MLPHYVMLCNVTINKLSVHSYTHLLLVLTWCFESTHLQWYMRIAQPH